MTLLETLVVPFRANEIRLADRYRQFLTGSKGLKLLDITQNLLCNAALLRANLGLKTADALQIAAALQEKCSAFITKDRRLPKIPNLRILQLSDYIQPQSRLGHALHATSRVIIESGNTSHTHSIFERSHGLTFTSLLSLFIPFWRCSSKKKAGPAQAGPAFCIKALN